MPVTRKQLYEDLWTEPALTVAKRYGVSSSFLARVCDRLNVPRPRRGYWAKRAAGRSPRRLPLPEARPGDETEWCRAGEKPSTRTIELRAPDPQAAQAERRPVAPGTRHPLVAGVRRHFMIDRVNRAGLVRPHKKTILDLFVSKQTAGRALRLVNALFLEFEARGHHVVLAPEDRYHRPALNSNAREDYRETWEPKRPTLVFIGTVAIGLTIFEVTEMAEMRRIGERWVRVPKRRDAAESPPDVGYGWQLHTRKQELPTGRLCVRASCPYGYAVWERRWVEQKPREILTIKEQIASELEAETPTLVKLVEEGRREWERQRKEAEDRHQQWVREQEEKRRQENIEAAREDLLAAIEAWGAARDIEAFFASVEEQAAALPEAARAAILDRLARGRALIGPLDALRPLRAWKAPEERPLERRWY